MRNHTSNDNGILNITLSDRLTFEDHEAFRRLLTLIEQRSSLRCVIDLKNVTAIDSAGLGLLMIAFETAEKAGVEFCLKSPEGQVARLLEISEFDKVMTILN
ncbi:STAS domain-containing protein [Sneathiella chinensis]|uniref:Anti-sigma factor antagonist n=1 Tax=Sneathiella chinensis TaxID=349750 RepID=A0ABQ5U714_9PROT|nr:STAS domain-containing protein [Sneathiella chinensis]GLQ06955.1 putative anti-sigma factor antagonist [Sneathiella chinensis]